MIKKWEVPRSGYRYISRNRSQFRQIREGVFATLSDCVIMLGAQPKSIFMHARDTLGAEKRVFYAPRQEKTLRAPTSTPFFALMRMQKGHRAYAIRLLSMKTAVCYQSKKRISINPLCPSALDWEHRYILFMIGSNSLRHDERKKTLR